MRRLIKYFNLLTDFLFMIIHQSFHSRKIEGAVQTFEEDFSYFTQDDKFPPKQLDLFKQISYKAKVNNF